MRKRTKYQKPKAKNKIPTLIIMCVTLFVILYFGKNISDSVAGFFTVNVPVTDAPILAVPDEKAPSNEGTPEGPRNTGAALSQAYRNAAQGILNLLSKGH